MDRKEYADWWGDMDYDPENVPEPQRTLARHVLTLWDRLDKLMDPDEHDKLHGVQCTCYLSRCACAYDHPDAICGVHDVMEVQCL